VTLEAAQWLTGLLIERYTPPDGLLARRVDVRAGRLVDPGGLVDELGDYVQYAFLVGREAGREDFSAWAVDQIQRASRDYQRPGGLFVKEPRDRAGRIEFFNALDIGDTIWGLAEMVALSGDAEVERIAARFVDGLWESALSGGQVGYGAMLARGRARARIPLTEPMTAGYVGESLVNLHLATGDRLYLDRARELLLPWLDLRTFKRHGLFTRWVTRSAPGLKTLFDVQFRLRGHHGLNVCRLTKGDTFLVMALLALWRVTHDEKIRQGLTRWSQAVERLRLADGRFANHLDLRTGRRWWVKLSENHSVIECLLDLHYDLGLERPLDLAVDCARGWLKLMTPAGLIPESDQEDRAHLDPQNDFMVDLFKLDRITGDLDFGAAAGRLIEAVLTRHRLDHGLAQTVTASTGRPESGLVETKFLGLFLKGLLINWAVGRGTDLMADPLWRRLATDR
jgi:hypothetical protein